MNLIPNIVSFCQKLILARLMKPCFYSSTFCSQQFWSHLRKRTLRSNKILTIQSKILPIPNKPNLAQFSPVFIDEWWCPSNEFEFNWSNHRPKWNVKCTKNYEIPKGLCKMFLGMKPCCEGCLTSVNIWMYFEQIMFLNPLWPNRKGININFTHFMYRHS